jgi:methyl-accepting chemotaxis protein
MVITLGRISVTAKIVLIIAVLIAAAAAISWIGVRSVHTMAASAHRIDLAATQIKIGAYINQYALEIGRSEYQVAANPGDLDGPSATIFQTKADLRERIEEARQTADPRQLELLEAVEAAFDDKAEGVIRTLDLAAEVTDVAIDAERQRVLDEVYANRASTEALREAVHDYVYYTEEHAAQISADAQVLTSDTDTINTTDHYCHHWHCARPSRRIFNCAVGYRKTDTSGGELPAGLGQRRS